MIAAGLSCNTLARRVGPCGTATDEAHFYFLSPTAHWNLATVLGGGSMQPADDNQLIAHA